MATIWVWRMYASADASSPIDRVDVTGFDVEAHDGKIGTVDEATYEEGSSCLIVDTGFWIFGKRRMIPAGLVERVDEEHRTVHVGCTKDHIKQAPDYDEVRKEDEAHRREIAEHYERLHVDAPH